MEEKEMTDNNININMNIISQQFIENLTLILITLKFIGYLDWPWVLILSPLLIKFIVFAVIGLLTGVFLVWKK